MASTHTLFQWAIENTSSPISEEKSKEVKTVDRKWIELLTQDDAKKMRIMRDTYKSDQSSQEEKEASLEELEFFVQMIDNANDLNHPNVDALKPIIEGLRDENQELRKRCANILGTAMQNNPKVQNQVLELDGTKALVDCLQNETNSIHQDALFLRDSLDSLGKLVYAISAFLSHNRKAQKQFWDLKGFQILCKNLSISREKLLEDDERLKKHEETLPEPPRWEDFKKNDTQPSDPNVNVLKDIMDTIQEIAEFKKIYKPCERKEKATSLWNRLSKKIVFLFNRTMAESEQFKLAFAKTDDGVIVKSIMDLIERNDDPDLIHKACQTIATITSNENPKIQEYIVDSIKSLNITNALETLKKSLESSKNNGHLEEESLHNVHEVLKKLQQIQGPLII